MNIVLGRKQVNKPNDSWQYVVDHIEDYVTREECDKATEAMKQRISEAVSGKKAAFAWSGGKDSLVLADICRQIGVTKCALFMTRLEYPAFESWLLENKPEGCEVIMLPYDLDWLKQHPEMLFPRGKEMQLWHKIVQRHSMISYFNKEHLDILMIGHRRKDGNTCGKDGFTRRKHGEVLYAPLYDWSHEMIFAYLHYNGIELPLIYKWDKGYFNGTHFWPSRICDSPEQGWREVYAIDPTVVVKAAEKLDEARSFLKEVRV